MTDYEQQCFPYEVFPDDGNVRSWLFFNVPGTARFGIEMASALADHLESLGVDLTPGRVKPPEKKYDAVGSSGGPWETGMWIDWDDERAPVTATAPDKDVTAMDAAERAELRAALDAAEDAERGRS